MANLAIIGRPGHVAIRAAIQDATGGTPWGGICALSEWNLVKKDHHLL